MAPYLPRNGSSGSPYSEGGALYALGLIHANHGQSIIEFLLQMLRNTGNEVRMQVPAGADAIEVDGRCTSPIDSQPASSTLYASATPLMPLLAIHSHCMHSCCTPRMAHISCLCIIHC